MTRGVCLSICGEVERPACLALAELSSLTDAELVADFHCREGWSRLGERWRGVRLRTLLAHADLLELRVEFFPYQPCAARVWELRENVTCYDGWYVAIAEMVDAPLATLDGRLANSPGPHCQFLLPPAET